MEDDKKIIPKKDKKIKKDKKKIKKSSKKRSKKQTIKTVGTTLQTSFKPTESGGRLSETQPFGAGGLGGFLSALGIVPKFQKMGGSTGFALPSGPTNIVETYKQPVAPKLQDKTVTYKEISPEEDQKREDAIFRKLDKGLIKMSKEDLRNHIYQYFGGGTSRDLDYHIQDAILEYKTKKGMLGAIARYANMGFGNINVDQLISFKPSAPVETSESVDLETVNVVTEPAEPAEVGGEDMNALGMPDLGGDEEED
jgi:hypothetical protein